MVGSMIAAATGGMPWKHNERQAIMQGQAWPEEGWSEEDWPEEDLSKPDLAWWHGMSPVIPAIEDALAVRSMPIVVAAQSGDTPIPTIRKIASIRFMRDGMFTSGHSHIGTGPQSPQFGWAGHDCARPSDGPRVWFDKPVGQKGLMLSRARATVWPHRWRKGGPLTSLAANGVYATMNTVVRENRLWWRTL
jgi:hypothetical protein